MRLVLVLCFLALGSSRRAATVVDSLPGFHGLLPFRLETGYVCTFVFFDIFGDRQNHGALGHVVRYITVDEENGAELFYYFVESEGDPHRDPLLLFLPAGNRCTVLQALMFQIGQHRLFA